MRTRRARGDRPQGYCAGAMGRTSRQAVQNTTSSDFSPCVRSAPWAMLSGDLPPTINEAELVGCGAP
jgi:hypothetical protein